MGALHEGKSFPISEASGEGRDPRSTPRADFGKKMTAHDRADAECFLRATLRVIEERHPCAPARHPGLDPGSMYLIVFLFTGWRASKAEPLSIGVTSNLPESVKQHKEGVRKKAWTPDRVRGDVR